MRIAKHMLFMLVSIRSRIERNIANVCVKFGHINERVVNFGISYVLYRTFQKVRFIDEINK